MQINNARYFAATPKTELNKNKNGMKKGCDGISVAISSANKKAKLAFEN